MATAADLRYLVDKSAWEQRRYDGRAAARMLELRRDKRLAYCVVTLAELMYSARNAEDAERIAGELELLAVTPEAESLLAESMIALARRGRHRMPIADLLLAAIARAHDAVVLHYDADFERIAEVTMQRREWIVPRGTGHGQQRGV